MKYGIVIKPIATIYEYASLTMESDGKTLSAISDQLLYGMLVAVVEEVKEYFFVKTFYGYSGYLPKEDLLLVDKSEAYEWEAQWKSKLDSGRAGLRYGYQCWNYVNHVCGFWQINGL